MAGPDVYLSWARTYSIFPGSLPRALPPPANERSFRSPFGINDTLFNAALRPEIPITFALLYVVAVFYLNGYNRSRNNQPWSIRKYKAFDYFVIAHNVLLALYSFATFVAMFRAAAHTLPAWEADNWRVRTADALCKLHGPRGLGDAATFNTTINIWETKNRMIHLGHTGMPDPTDVGRLWNEGLAFWGWMFYASKFYEVVDTLIILAKGKRSGTLQTYHHSGAMLCMWAGIRYMSPPIWMFVFINSGIHALMYTYFTLSALGVKVPRSMKQTLTILQIGQIIFGASYAALHLFVQYDIPLQTAYQVVKLVERAASSASSAARSATSVVSSFAEDPTLPASWGGYVKKFLLRAAGEEGVAERVGIHRQNPFVPPVAANIEEKVERFIEQRFETKWRNDWTKIDCIDTPGEAFAIYLNLLYLSPLLGLFVRFFIKAYTQRAKPRTVSQAARDAADSATQARSDTSRAIEKSGEEAEDEVFKRGSQAQEEAQELQEQLKKDVKEWKDGNWQVKERVSGYEQRFKETVSSVKETLSEQTSSWQSGNEEAVEEPAEEAGKPVESEQPLYSEVVKEEPKEESKGEPKADPTPSSESAVEDEPAKQTKQEDPPQEISPPSPESTFKSDDSSSAKSKSGAGLFRSGLFRRSSSKSAKSESKTTEAHSKLFRTSSSRSSLKGNKISSIDESTPKQDENIAASQETRPAPEEPKPADIGPSTAAEPAEKQDDNLDDTKETRPGTAETEDTDAMGKSGLNVGSGSSYEEQWQRSGDE